MSVMIRDDEQGMRAALREAQASAERDEVPVGCVIVHEGLVIGRGHNQVEGLADATAHAEIVAIGAASSALGSWRLSECTLYVTLEPCAMCAGAIVLARLGRLVYGAADPKAGACGSVLDVIHEPRLNHRVDVTSGVLAEACGELLREFFAAKRRASAAKRSGAKRSGAPGASGRAAPRSTRHRNGLHPGGRS
jgi:tRNA(adenine34) deaminase